MREKNIDAPELVVENGAGVSLTERVSPRTLARLLHVALERPYGNALMASLPVAGVDGTLHSRLVQSPAAGKAFLKTGSLPEVRSLAGYVRDAGIPSVPAISAGADAGGGLLRARPRDRARHMT